MSFRECVYTLVKLLKKYKAVVKSEPLSEF